MKHRQPPRGLVSAAIAIGMAAGVVLSRPSEPRYGFLHGARPMQISDYRNGEARGIVRFYNLRQDWKSVISSAIKESPLAVVRDSEYKGIDAHTVVIPREEAGRAKIFDTPEREITVIRGHFVLGESGIPIVRTDDDGTWSGIQVVEFRRPHLLDSASEWMGNALKA